MFDRPKTGERAVLIHIDIARTKHENDKDEFRELANAAGAQIVEELTCTRAKPDAKYFVGTGKAEELQEIVSLYAAEVALFDQELTPAQERNLERLLKCRVLDRTGLILDIFAQRARTFEGKLQVELAQLEHLSTRLVRGWTHLERQKGGIGLRGPGETQLETDRRLLRNRITSIKKRLTKVHQQRELSRRSRNKASLPCLALVGYTNAGKSTLFNHLTDSEIYTADQLFATLDPTLRAIQIPSFGKAVLIDTVGFINNLPHELIDAFQATLEETQQANLLLHVIDASDSFRSERKAQVNDVLIDVGAESITQLQVYNKIDSLNKAPLLERDEHGIPFRVWLSALTGEGLDLLFEAIAELLGKDIVYRELMLLPDQADLRAAFYRVNGVVAERIDEEGRFLLSVRLPRTVFERVFH